MAQQVKFYSVSSLPASTSAGGIYFVDNGELYKGGKRFGALKVTTNGAEPTGPIGGDIKVSNGAGDDGNTYVYDGDTTSWVKIATAPTNVLSGLNFSKIGDSAALTSIIGFIEQTNGQIDAKAYAFPSITTGDADGQVKLNGVSATVNGWSKVTGDIISLSESVNNHETRISEIETWQSSVTGDTIVSGTKLTAQSGKFTNLTVGGKTVSEIANAQISAIGSVTADNASDNDVVTVSVTTESGSVKEVKVGVAAVTASTGFVDNSEALATAKGVVDYVEYKMADVVAPMNFLGVKESTSAVTNPKGGDVIIVGTKEYVYDPAKTGDKWVELGDESEIGNLASYAGYNTALTTTAQTLAGGINELDGKIKDMDFTESITQNGVTTYLTQVDGRVTAFGLNIAPVEASAGVVSTETGLITTSAVYDFVTGTIDALDSTVNSADNTITIVETDGKLTSVTLNKTTSVGDTGTNAAIPTEKAVRTAINAAITAAEDAVTGGNHTDSSVGVSVKVTTAKTTAAPTVDVEVTPATTIRATGTADNNSLATEGAVRGAIDALDVTSNKSDVVKGIAVTVNETDGKVQKPVVEVTAADTMAFGASGDANTLATTKAVKDCFDNNLVWLDANGNAIR